MVLKVPRVSEVPPEKEVTLGRMDLQDCLDPLDDPDPREGQELKDFLDQKDRLDPRETKEIKEMLVRIFITDHYSKLHYTVNLLYSTCTIFGENQFLIKLWWI